MSSAVTHEKSSQQTSIKKKLLNLMKDNYKNCTTNITHNRKVNSLPLRSGCPLPLPLTEYFMKCNSKIVTEE